MTTSCLSEIENNLTRGKIGRRARSSEIPHSSNTWKVGLERFRNNHSKICCASCTEYFLLQNISCILQMESAFFHLKVY